MADIGAGCSTLKTPLIKAFLLEWKAIPVVSTLSKFRFSCTDILDLSEPSMDIERRYCLRLPPPSTSTARVVEGEGELQ